MRTILNFCRRVWDFFDVIYVYRRSKHSWKYSVWLAWQIAWHQTPF